MKAPVQSPIAIVGLSALFPGSEDVVDFWRDIIEARDRIGDVPPTHWLIEDYYDPDPAAPDKTYCKRGGFLAPVPFEPMEFGIPPNALPATDSAQLLALVAAKRVLEDAARTRAGQVDPDRISVVLGVASTTELVVAMGARLQHPVWRKALREAGLPEDEVADIVRRIGDEYAPWQESTFPGLLGNVVAGRIANRLNLGGMNCVIDAACASSLAAVELAIKELEQGDSDMVITGGVDALNDIMMYMCFSKTPAFSPTGDCRPFSDQADGTIIGEGVGMLALRRLEDAERDGDSIYAVIKGLGASSDGRASSVYAPRPEGQAKALKRAYAKAGYGPETVGLVEAHGTGTKAGDAAEFEGLKSVFAADAPDRKPWCALGSVKSQIGHTKAAAGSAGLIKAALALNEKVLPPTLKVERPNPALKIEESPFYLNTAARPWIRSEGEPRRASVSSFGFGGSNFHITLEEYSGSNRAPRLRALPEELVLLSAASKAELAKSVADLAQSSAPLALAAHECARNFDAAAPARLALVAATREEFGRNAARAAEALRSGTEETLRDPDIAFGFGMPEEGATAFLFPGQGSQYVGMGAAAAMAFDCARTPWDAAAGLKMFAGLPLHDIAFPPAAFDTNAQQGQVKRLTEMANAQPAIAAVSLAFLNLLDSLGVEADALAGHSFGEVTALAAAGVFERAALVQVARRRGELMTEAARGIEGAMLACSLDGHTVREILGPAARDIVIANDNAPNQIVLAGPVSAIGAAEGKLKAAGKSGYRLPVATAFHSPLVAPSCEPFRDYLNRIDLCAPELPVYSNATTEIYPAAPAAIARLLSDQLAQPVQFRPMIERMYAGGVRTFVEVGPGRVLTGLVEQCLAGRPHLAVALDDRKAGGLRALWRGLARLAAAGFALDLPTLFRGYAAPVAAKAPSKHAVMISGTNLGRPYPPKGGAAALPPPNPERAGPNAAAASPSLLRGSGETEDAAFAPPTNDRAIHPPVPQEEAGRDWALRNGATDISAIERIHRETFEAHRAYQETMARSHQAFLDLAGRAIAQMGGVPAAGEVRTLPLAESVPHAGSRRNAETPAARPAESAAHAPGVRELGGALPAASAAAPVRAPAFDPARVLIEIVAEKTGYPADMLGLDLELEAGLGIDSIKQVEILSAVQERLPGMPEIKPSELARLKTLRDIIQRLGEANIPASPTQASPPPRAPAGPNSPPRAAPAPVDATELLLDIVAEKTGYPKDMLALDQEMEAGLGIDSIKQVEILSAVQERLPDLPEIEPSELGTLKTLRDVARRLSAAAGAGPAPPMSEPAKPQPPAEAMPRPAPMPEAAPEPEPAPLLLAAPVLAAAPAPGFDMTGRRAGETIYVTNEVPALASAIKECLQSRGRSAEVVARLPEGASAAVSLAALGAGADAGLAAHLAALDTARAVARHPNPEERLFAAVQSAAGFGLAGDPGAAAWTAGIAGIVKTAAQEWPGAGLKAIDLADLADVRRAAALIVGELVAGGPEIEVAFCADGRRRVVRLAAEAAAPEIGLPLAPGAVILVSGGARGVTARSAEALAAAGNFRLVLLGRTALGAVDPELGSIEDQARLVKLLASRAQNRGEMVDLAKLRTEARALASANAARAQLARLAARGIEARYLAADVRDGASLAAALDGVRAEWGPIGGLIHGAGILADKRIADLSNEQFEQVFATKAGGFKALLDATRADPLRLIAVFSSVAARHGNAGQAAYAAANEVLNKAAAHEARTRGPACRVRSYNWGPWDGGMVDGALKAHFERRGAGLIGLDEGADFFAKDMAAARPVEIVATAPGVPPAGLRASHIDIDPARDGELLDHKIRGRIVVPLVHVLDRALRLAEAMPGCGVNARLQDVRVLGGVTLAEGEKARLLVRAVPLAEDDPRVEITFMDATARARYRAIADFPDAREIADAAPGAAQEPWPLSVEEAYRGALFHGPRFRAIRALNAISGTGGEAELLTAEDLGWPAGARAIDPAMIDGGLQLGLLWTKARNSFLSLPQRIGSFRRLRAPRGGEGVICRFRAKLVNATRADFDFVFLQGGEAIAEIRDAEFIAYEA